MRKKAFFRIIAALLAIVLLAGCMPAFAEEANSWMHILLLGCDSYTKNTRERTDSMIILSINTQTYQVKMTSLMRDMLVSVPGSRGLRKLTELCIVGGPEMTMQSINENLGMSIDKYMLISMAGIAEIIDLIGGIELDVTEAERKALNKGLFDLSGLSGMEKLEQSGENVHLNGNQATAYARIRKIDSDYVRTERQRTVLLVVAAKLKEGASPATLLSIITTLLNYVETNLNLTEIMALAGMSLQTDLSTVGQFRIPVDGTFTSGMSGEYWSIRPNFPQNAAALHEFIYGE